MLRSGSCLSLWERWHCASNAGEGEPVNSKKAPCRKGKGPVGCSVDLNKDLFIDPHSSRAHHHTNGFCDPALLADDTAHISL